MIKKYALLFLCLLFVSTNITGGDTMIIRTKLLTDATYSPTSATSEEAIRTQIDGSIQEVADLVEESVTIDRKLSAAGDFTGTILGLAPIASDPYLSTVVAGHTTQLAENATYVSSGNNIFEPLVQPSALTTSPPYFANGNTITSDGIHTLYDGLMSDYPSYIAKTVLGKDQSGVFDICKYVFAPPNFEKTLIFTSGFHGLEVSAPLALYRFLKLLCENVVDYPQLAYLKNKVRIVVVPVVNPWGMNQATRIRYNSRDVDINRNFNYRWTANTHYGASPASEAETILVQALMATYSNAIAYIDFHNTLSSNDADYYFSNGQYANASANLVLSTFNKINNNGARIRYEASGAPLGVSYASDTYGMFAFGCELMDGNFGVMYSSLAITHGVRWFGNAIIDMAKQQCNAVSTNKEEPFTVISHYGAAGDAPNLAVGGVLTEIPQFRHEFDVPCQGIIDVDLSATVYANSGVPTTAIAISVTQGGGIGGDGISTAPESAIATQNARTMVYFDSIGKRLLATHYSIRVEPTSDLYGKVSVRVYAYTTDGSAQVMRLRTVSKFTPSNALNKITIFTPNTRMANGTSAMQIESQV